MLYPDIPHSRVRKCTDICMSTFDWSLRTTLLISTDNSLAVLGIAIRECSIYHLIVLRFIKKQGRVFSIDATAARCTLRRSL